MKMLKFLAMAMLCFMTGINFELQAKIDICSLFRKETPCNKADACSWANGACSRKNTTQSGTSTNSGTGTSAGPNGSPSVAVTLQVFTPDTQFANAGATGSYDSNTQTATISSLGKSYSFTGIKEVSTMVRPFGLTKIGTFANPNYVASNASCSGCPTRTTTLYGTLASQNEGPVFAPAQ